MATETEIKLSLSPRAASRFSRHPLLLSSESKRVLLVNIYYDTPDRRLQRERVVVRHRRKGQDWLLSVKTVALVSAGLAQRGEWEVPGQRGRFDFSQVDDERVRSSLEAARDQLQPLFTTRFWRKSWVLDAPGGGRCEVALDRGWIEAGDQKQAICEVEIELLAGPLNGLFDIARALQAGLHLHPEASSKSERAYRLLANLPLAASKALPVPTSAGMSAIAAFRLIAQACLNHLQNNEIGVCTSTEPEFVHQARVAIRRLRSAIRLWEPLLPETFVATFDPLWQQLASRLGETRNWDVFVAETLPLIAAAFPDQPTLDRLTSNARAACAESRRHTQQTLRAAAYSRLLIEFSAALVDLSEADSGALAAFVPRCLKKRARRVDERAAVAVAADAAARHRLRVAFKQLRYGVEFFCPLLAGPALSNYHQVASRLQELLGHLNDLAVAAQLTAESLPGNEGESICSWLNAQTESLLPELRQLLTEFQRQEVPWVAP